MTIGDLKKELAVLDDALLVVVSADEEGNRFSPVADLCPCQYTPARYGPGDIKIPDPGDPNPDPAHWNPKTDAINAVCLWPLN